jgi:hypothetical protein
MFETAIGAKRKESKRKAKEKQKKKQKRENIRERKESKARILSAKHPILRS